jgi:hypothetical protein
MKKFHRPLPDLTHAQLHALAEQARLPATSLAREAIDAWLREQSRKARRGAVAAYASEMAGTDLDLDPQLEAAGIEHLTQTKLNAKKGRK